MKKEHSVMYPIDLLKVWMKSIIRKWPPNTDLRFTDPHASRQPYTRRHLHRYRQCDLDHLKSRGLHVIVEGCLECGTRRR